MRILAIGCHPDDLEIGCYGTLIKYIKQGHEVSVCHIANGNMGHVEIMPDELRRIRHEEAAAAARLIGAKQSAIARLESGRHNPSVRLLGKIATAIGKKLSIKFE